MLLQFIAVVSQYPPNPGTPVWITILLAMIGMIGGGLGWNVYKRWRTGQVDDAIQISQNAIEQARGAKDLFVEYRVELEASQRQIAEMLDKLIEVNRALGEANARIHRLDEDLRAAHGEHASLKRSLVTEKKKREEATQAREKVLAEMSELREKILELEKNGGVESDSVSDNL